MLTLQPRRLLSQIFYGAERTDEDRLIKAIGAFGKWQIWICVIIFIVKFSIGWHQLSIIFLAPPMDFTCSSNVTQFDNVCRRNCTTFSYDRSIFEETIISQWNLVCKRSWLKNLTQTIFMFGILVGSFIFGYLSDRYGRRTPFLGAIALQLVFGILTAYSINWIMFTVVRFILAIATGGTIATSFVLIIEMIGTKHRDIICILYQVPMNLAHLSLPLFSYYLRHWSKFQLAISLPSLIYLSYYFVLPESPRWLLTVGRIDEAAKIMKKAAKRNGLPTESIEATAQILGAELKGKQPKRVSYITLFRTPQLRKRTCAIGFNWFSSGFCYFGVSQYIGNVSGNIFTNVAMSGAIQIPGTLLSILTNKWFGRKPTLICCNCLTGISCILIIFASEIESADVILGCVGLCGITMAFTTVYLYAGELFPTVVRNLGVGLSSTIARAGSMIAPFVATLSQNKGWIPPAIFGLMPLLGAAVCIILPETRGKKLPDTIEDAERLTRVI